MTPFISADVRIMFETENQKSMKDGDRVKFDNFNLFAWGDTELFAWGDTEPFSDSNHGDANIKLP